MKPKALFNIFPKTLQNGKVVYYYTCYDLFGKRHQYSTGKTKKREAIDYCILKFKNAELIPVKNYNFKQYIKNWFIYDKCPYIQGRLLRDFSYSKSNAEKNRRQLELHIIPYFENLKISEITSTHIETWLTLLKKKKQLSNLSLNHSLSILKVILNEAERLGDIQNNPTKSVRNLSAKSKEKGIITEEERDTLFNEVKKDEIWNKQDLHYLLNLTASVTGMRLGELQALKMENVRSDHIHVAHSWDRKFGIKGTKTGKNRDIPIKKDLYQKLLSFYRSNCLKGFYIFSVDGGHQPVDHKAIYKWYGRAFDNIGLTADVRKERNITFHSWRHYLNSQLRLKGVPDSVVMLLTGHSSVDMMEHYTHFGLKELKRFLG